MKAFWAVGAVILLAGAIFFFTQSDPAQQATEQGQPLETLENLPAPPAIENVQADPAAEMPVESDPNWQPPETPETSAEENLETVLRMEAEDAVRSGQIQAHEVDAFLAERRAAYETEKRDDASGSELENEMEEDRD